MAKKKTNKSVIVLVLIVGIMAFLLSQLILGDIINSLSVLLEQISSIVISVIVSYFVLSELNKKK